jgi:hypothetical protein
MVDAWLMVRLHATYVVLAWGTVVGTLFAGTVFERYLRYLLMLPY